MNSLYLQTLLANEKRKTADLEKQLEAFQEKDMQASNCANIHEMEAQALETQIAILQDELKVLQSSIDTRNKSLTMASEQLNSEQLATNALMAQKAAHSALIASAGNKVGAAINILNGIRSGENVTPNEIWEALSWLDHAGIELAPKK